MYAMFCRTIRGGRVFATIALLFGLCFLIAPSTGAARAKRPTRPKMGWAKVTFYCRRCNSGGRVADPHRRVTDRGGVAADPRYHPLGSQIYIAGFGTRRVDDTGGAIKGPNRFDVRLTASGKCHRYGVKRLRYRVLSHAKKKRRH
jgi:3D (Asp-Asp-Asp) domain-containing protein